MVSLPECPASFRALQHYLKTAFEHDSRDPVVAYWCRLHALQIGMKLTAKKSPEESKLLIAIMDWLEQQKQTHKDNEAITNEVAAQAHLENYALELFLYADKMDHEQQYNKKVVKAFYTAGMIYDVLTEFGELSEEAGQNRKYAKWKATYIHNCLKNGETPVPGPMPSQDGTETTPSDTASNSADLTPNPPPSLPNTGFTPNPGFSAYPGLAPNSAFTPIQPGVTPGPAPSNFGQNLPDPSVVSRLPAVPHTPDPNPGGFVPYAPSGSDPTHPTPPPTNLKLSAAQLNKAQKYCKYASSAMNYEDIPTAITNLQNALQLLQTGRDPA